MNILERILEEIEIVVKLDNFDSCIIGVSCTEDCLIYSKKLIIESLSKEMSIEDSLEHFEYNIIRSLPYMGINKPIICNDYFK